MRGEHKLLQFVPDPHLNDSLEAEVLYLPTSFSAKPDHYMISNSAEVPITFGRPDIFAQVSPTTYSV